MPLLVAVMVRSGPLARLSAPLRSWALVTSFVDTREPTGPGVLTERHGEVVQCVGVTGVDGLLVHGLGVVRITAGCAFVDLAKPTAAAEPGRDDAWVDIASTNPNGDRHDAPVGVPEDDAEPDLTLGELEALEDAGQLPEWFRMRYAKLVEPMRRHLMEWDSPYQQLNHHILSVIRSSGVNVEADRTAAVIQAYFESLPRTVWRSDIIDAYYYPANWTDLAVRPTIVAASLVAGTDGVSIAWVPPGDIVTDLLAAVDLETRRQIIIARSTRILDDCRRVLREVDRPDLASLVERADDAIAAIAAGHSTAGQALAANAFDTWLRHAFRRGSLFAPAKSFKFAAITDQLKSGDDLVKRGAFRATWVLLATLKALDTFDALTDDAPATYSRHATAHSASSIQYTPANAHIAVLLLVSVLRETQASNW